MNNRLSCNNAFYEEVKVNPERNITAIKCLLTNKICVCVTWNNYYTKHELIKNAENCPGFKKE